MSWQEDYLRRFYNRETGWTDGTAEFHEMCRSHIPAGGSILEVGAGPSNPTSEFLSRIGELHGLDPDPDVERNEYLRSAAVMQGDRFPYPDASFHACVSNFVMEHVQDPARHLDEVARVLRPGGVYIFRTPNKFHYVSLIAQSTPHWFHTLVANRVRNLPEEAHEPYPTYHALNSAAAVRRAAPRHGFQVAELRMVEKEPSYGMASRALFLPFMVYERFVNSTERLAPIRASIFAALRRAP